MSQIVSPFLISLGVLAGVVFSGWILSSWLHDRYSVPSGQSDQEDQD